MSSHTNPVQASWKKRAFVDEAGYKAMYAESVKSPEKFWAKQAKRLDSFKAPTRIKNTLIKGFTGAETATKIGIVAKYVLGINQECF